MERKSFPILEMKAVGDGEPGVFEAIVAVFGNVDLVGDVVEKGAFTESLKRGFPPIVWAHQWNEVPIGATLAAEERDQGLYIKGKLFIDDNQKARESYAAMKTLGGDGKAPLRQFSFAYDILEAAEEVDNGEETRHLKQLDLLEVGPCLIGVNPATELISVKGSKTRLSPPQRPVRVEKAKAAGEVVWGAEDGFYDLMSDVADLLNPDDGGWPRYWCMDIAVDLSRALVSAPNGDVFVVPITVENGEPTAVAPSSDWIEVDQAWVADADADDEKARLHELKSGRVLSATNEQSLRDAHSAIQDVLDQLDSGETDPSGAEDGKSENYDRTLELLFSGAPGIEVASR